jgi:hypothetical protein
MVVFISKFILWHENASDKESGCTCLGFIRWHLTNTNSLSHCLWEGILTEGEE